MSAPYEPPPMSSASPEGLGAEPVDLSDIGFHALRAYRARLREDEDRVSYWRRLVQARLDLIKAEKAAESLSLRDLLTSLSSTASGVRRQQFLSVKAEDPLPFLPGLDDLWTAAIDPNDPAGNDALVAALSAAETTLSRYRKALHGRIDAATAELVSRYKSNPDLALDIVAV